MKSKYAQSRLDYLDTLFSYFGSLTLDEMLKSHVAKYLTVLISGIYEDIIKNFVVELTQRDTINKCTKQFIFNRIKLSLRNPDFENLKGFLNQFDKEWIKILNKEIEEKHISALNSIIANKNLIAHGDPSVITFDNIKEFYGNSKIILLKLDSIIL